MKRLLNANVRLPIMAGLLAFSVSFGAFAQVAAPVAVASVQRSISVQGEAKGEFEPDQAMISFAVVSRDPQLNVAKKKNDEVLQRLVAVTQTFEIPKEKVVTSGVFISPEYNYNNKNNVPRIVGYHVSRNFSIVTKDIARQEELLSALIDVKIDQVNNVEFQLSDPEKRASELRVKAFENAKARAASLAEAAGAKLGPALLINTSGNMNMPQPPRMMMAMADAGMEKSASVAPTMPGAITMMETVSVTFALE